MGEEIEESKIRTNEIFDNLNEEEIEQENIKKED